MLGKSVLENELDIDIPISDDMISNIELWDEMYSDKSSWVDGKVIRSCNLASAITNEIARLVTIEFKSEISGNDYLNEQYQKVIKDIRKYTEYACAKGGLVFKPYVDREKVQVEYVQAERFYPTNYDSSGDINGAIFVDSINKGNKIYTKLEYHNLTDKGYYIANYAYVKDNKFNNFDIGDLGKQIALNLVDEWSELQEEVIITNIDKPLFSYFKIPIANNIDKSSPLGMSVFSKAVDLIKDADAQYGRLLWEFEGSELAIDADVTLFKVNPHNGEAVLPSGKERLYRAINGDVDNKWNVFNPDIRDVNIINGLNEILRKIEFNCGLAYGTLSDMKQAVEKTATEIKASKQRSYATISDIQGSLKSSLEHLGYAMQVWSKLYNLPSNNFDMSFNFDDSLVLDKDAELLSMQADVASGILRPEIYIAKKYGVTEEEALKMMPKISDTMNDPFEGSIE